MIFYLKDFYLVIVGHFPLNTTNKKINNFKLDGTPKLST
jgi:hypothetical protein